MKHVKLYENFGRGGMQPFQNSGKVYATCFQGDSFAAVGILNEQEKQKFLDACEKNKGTLFSPPDIASVHFVDVKGMKYVLHDTNGEFTAMPHSTNPNDYDYFVRADGEMPFNSNPNADDTSRLFDLVEGKMLVIDVYSSTELLTANEFIEKYLGD
jgi:hypothetical protein